MKKTTFIILLILLLANANMLMAQDTLSVVPFTGQADYVSLTDVIHGDTLSDGTRANLNRVYKLAKGGFYLLNDRIEAADFDLILIGEPGDDSTPPPLIMHDVDPDGNHANDMIRCGLNFTAKNILFNASDILGSASSRFIDINSIDSRIVIDNCIFVNFKSRLIDLRGTVNIDIFVTNNLATNTIDTNNEWGAHIFHSASTDGDTMWVQNNTFFNFGHNGTAPGTQFKFSWWNHNTFVNFGHRMLGHDYNLEHYFTENLLYNISIVGEASEWFPANGGSWEAVFGIVDSDTLVGGPNPNRVIVYDANSIENSEAFDLLYDNYSGNTRRLYVPIMGERLQWILDDDATWPNAHEGTWYEESPTFTDEALVLANLDQQIGWTEEAWQDSVPPVRTDRLWDMDGDNDLITTPWPIPLDLSYTNQTLLTGAHRGLPVGDLNWFPAEKAQWETQKTAIEDDIKNGQMVVVGVEQTAPISSDYHLAQNYPNPFNPSTKITFDIKKEADVKLTVFNVLGQQVKVLVNENLASGSYNAIWDGTNELNQKVNTGIYFYKLQTSDFVQVRKMMLLK